MDNAKIEIYTTPTCPFCSAAKELLQRKSLAYTEIDASDAQTRDAMQMRAEGRRSVPQIFINDTHIGGCDDLYALEQTQKLDALLGL